MAAEKSYKTILRSTSIMGGASVARILISLIRTKFVAVLLGPSGIGLLGLLSSVMQTTSTVAGLGIPAAGARQIAAARTQDEGKDLGVVRRSLFWGAMLLSSVGGLALLLLRKPIAKLALGDASAADQIGWLSLGVLLLIASGSQGALLTGLRRIGDLARIQISSAVLATIIGVGSLFLWGEEALLVLILVPPATIFLMGHWYVSRLESSGTRAVPWAKILVQWRAMAALGLPIMLGALVELLSPLVMRVTIQRDLGTESLGHFQASWTIAQTYLVFILGAMSTDYFPRLSSVMTDSKVARRLVNEQSEVAILLAGPVILTLLVVSPWVVPILYTTDFAVTVDILRWQLLGDAFRVVGWPLSFVVLAAGMGTVHLAKIIAMNVVLLGSTFLLIDRVGVIAPGMGFCLMNMVHLPLIWWVVHKRIDFKWSASVKRQALTLIGAAMILVMVAQGSNIWSAVIGLPVIIAMGLHALVRLASMAELSGPVGRLAAAARRWMPKAK